MNIMRHFEEPGSSIAVLPDLQNYTCDDTHFHVLEETIDWLARESPWLAIDLVIQVGDLTNRNQSEEWKRARQAFSRLDGVLPYVLAVGNHDLGRHKVGGCRFTRINRFFKLEQNPLNQLALVDSFAKGQLENAAFLHRIGGTDWLILSLEFGPREPVLHWASEVLSRHSAPSILVTHEFIDHKSLMQTGEAQHTTPETHNSPYCYGLATAAGGVSCGEEVWRRLVEPNSRIQLVLNGHYRPWEKLGDGTLFPSEGVASASRYDVRSDGSGVHQHLINAQWAPRGGDGWLKMFRFGDRGELLRSDLISPVLEQVGV